MVLELAGVINPSAAPRAPRSFIKIALKFGGWVGGWGGGARFILGARTFQILVHEDHLVSSNPAPGFYIRDGSEY